MKRQLTALTLTLTVALILFRAIPIAAAAPQKVLLRNIKTLTLHKDRQTTHRRVPALPQLHCVGGSGCKYHTIDTLRCSNSGSSYGDDDVEWTCTAQLPPEFKLGATDVVCEGYDHPDDPYVLRGSCAVEYRLLLTDAGMRRYQPGGGWWSGAASGGAGAGVGARAVDGAGREPLVERLLNALFWMLFLGVALWIGWNFLASLGRGRGGERRLPRGGRGGGGGGGGDDDDSPPPYEDLFGSARPRQSKPRARAAPSASSGGAAQPGSSWTSFLSGAGLGAAGAYAAGSLLERRRREQERERERYWGREHGWGREPERHQGQGWMQNLFGREDTGEGPSGARRASTAQPAEARYESTGFGSTRRR